MLSDNKLNLTLTHLQKQDLKLINLRIVVNLFKEIRPNLLHNLDNNSPITSNFKL